MNQSEQLSLPRGPTPTDDALYKRALAIRQKSLGPDHPSVATSLQNLGRFYQLQGRYADAELLYKRSLAIREKALDLNNPDVAL
jgi:tetratricopeptide (TPR) repeat protein